MKQGAPLHMTVEDNGRLRFVPIDEVESIVACRNYVVVHAAGASNILRSTLKRVEDQLAGRSFLRVERSILVNLRHVLDVQCLPRRRFRLRMRNGQTHLSGASCYEAIVAYLCECQPFMVFPRARRTGKVRDGGNATPQT